MTYYIDDAFFEFGSKAGAKHRTSTILKILTALGFFLSIHKSQLLAARTGTFLGLLVNALMSSF